MIYRVISPMFVWGVVFCHGVGVGAETAYAVTWPTYQRDSSRSATIDNSEGQLTLPLEIEWEYQVASPPAPAWPPPARQNFWGGRFNLQPRVVYDRAFHVVSDGKRVLFGSSSDDQIRCLELATGKLVWSFFAEGPVRLAPVLHHGKAYFGSDDGCVYCLNIADGAPVWKVQPMEDRRIPGTGRIISTWPIRSGVIVTGNHARFAAGLFPLQGARQFAADLKTGEIVAQSPVNFSPQGYMQLKDNQLTIATGRTAPANLAQVQADADKRRGATTAPPKLADFPYATIRVGDHLVAGGENKIAVFDAAGSKKVQELAVDGRAYSLAFAGEVKHGFLLVSTDKGVVHCFSGFAVGSGRDRILEQADSADIKPAKPETSVAQAVLPARKRGYALCLGAGTEATAVRLAETSELRVVLGVKELNEVTAARTRLSAAGRADRVAVSHLPEETFPFADGLFNQIVLCLDAYDVPPNEVHRLLTPQRGEAILFESDAGAGRMQNWLARAAQAEQLQGQVTSARGLTRVARGPLEGAGEWSHIYADPANTACSREAIAGAGKMELQWFGPPGPREMIDRHHRTVPPLSVAGRLFIPGDNRVYGVDAQNGTVLWDVPIPGSRRVGALRDAGSMAATADSVYIAAGDKCVRLDAESGRRLAAFEMPNAGDHHPRVWGYVCVVGDRLLGTAAFPGASLTTHSKDTIGGTYYDGQAIVTATSLFCLDRDSGKVLWNYDGQTGAIGHPTLCVADGRVHFFETSAEKSLAFDRANRGREPVTTFLGTDGSAARLVALDLADGKPIYREQIKLPSAQHIVFLSAADGRLLVTTSRNAKAQGAGRLTLWYDFTALDAATGRHLWYHEWHTGIGTGGSHGEQDQHPAIVGNRMYLRDISVDMETGKRISGWQWNRSGHGCGTFSASNDALFFRGANPTMCSLSTGKNAKLTTVTRPGCWINIVPAAGLILIPEASSGCTCGFSVQTSMALAPGKD